MTAEKFSAVIFFITFAQSRPYHNGLTDACAGHIKPHIHN